MAQNTKNQNDLINSPWQRMPSIPLWLIAAVVLVFVTVVSIQLLRGGKADFWGFILEPPQTEQKGNIKSELENLKNENIKIQNQIIAQKEAIDDIKSKVQPEIPVGTVISSILPPEKFRETPGHIEGQWVVGTGQTLPKNSMYERITGNSRATTRHLDQALTVTSIVAKPVNHGEDVFRLLPSGNPLVGNWVWLASLRDVQGNSYNNDWEQDVDHFQVWIDEAKGQVISQGRTYNRKWSQWGAWKPGTSTVLGIATSRQSLYHYVKIN